MDILHMFAHWFGWNKGNIISAYDDDDNLWIAFECSTCGKVSGSAIFRGET